MKRIEKLLPGYNCGECGLSSCREFAAKLVDVVGLERCPMLKQERFPAGRSRSPVSWPARMGERRSWASWTACGPTSPWLL